MTHDEAHLITPGAAERQLAAPDRDFYLALEQAIGAGIAVVDSAGRQTYVNPAFCAMVGRSAQELTGELPPFIYWPAEEISAIEAALHAMLAGNIPAEGFELRFCRADGSRFDVLVQIKPFDQAGQSHWCATVYTISERKQIERALRDEIAQRELVAREREQVLAQHQAMQQRLVGLTQAISILLDSLQQTTVIAELMELAQELIKADAYAIWRADDRTQSWRIVQAVGLSATYQQSIALTTSQFMRVTETPIIIEDVRQIPGFAERKAEYEQEGIQALLVLPLKLHGEFAGTLVFYYHQAQQFSALDLGVASALSHLTAATIGTTEIYAAQQQLQVQAETIAHQAQFLAEASATLNSSLDAHMILCQVAELAVPLLGDWCGVYVVNDNATFMPLIVTHQAPEKIEQAREMFHRYPPDASTSSGLMSVLQAGKSVLVSDVSPQFLQQIAHDSTHLELLEALGMRSYMLVPVFGRERKIGVLSLAVGASRPKYSTDDLRFAEDLAQRAAMAIVNAQLYAEAQAALDTRNQFLSIAAHELKTPMTALLGNAQLLARRLGHPQEQPTPELRLANTIAQQTQRLNRLCTSLLDLTRLQRGLFALEPVPIDLAAILGQVVTELQPVLEKFPITCQAPAATLIAGDPLRLEEVFYNLIQNAAKYSPQGGPILITLECEQHEAVVCVTDHGIGIPPAAFSLLFEPFYRATHSQGHKSSGMGLGLYVVKEIISLHGGSVGVTSTEGQGSTFEVRLPLLDQG